MVERTVLLAPLGGETNSLADAVRLTRCAKVHVLFCEQDREVAHARAELLRERGIEVRTSWIIGDPWREVAHLCGTIHRAEHGVLLCLSAASDELVGPCVAAAAMHAIPTITLVNRKIVRMPTAAVPLSAQLGKAKCRILFHLQEKKVYTLGALTKQLGISAPLLLHHLRGKASAPGLEMLGFVERVGRGGVVLSELGATVVYALRD